MTTPPTLPTRRHRMLVVLGFGLLAAAVWLASGFVTIDLLAKDRLLPLWWVGAGAIPAVTVAYLVRATMADTDPRLAAGVLRTLAFGGAVAIALAAPLNGLLIPDDSAIWWVGLTEESSKLAAALLLSTGLARSARSGLALGAAAGLGFAVWENAGYLFGEYADAGSATGEIVFAAQRDLIGIPLHAFFAGFIACAVFAAIARPTAVRILRAVLVFAVVAATHSAYDWAQFTIPDGSLLGIAWSDWLAGALVLVLVAVWLVLLRRLRATRMPVPPPPASTAVEGAV